MEMIRCIAIDDEPLALAQIQAYANRTPGLKLIECCADVERAVELINQGDVDLLFLDINMPDINGMEWAKSLSASNRPFIIFTTAYSEYAIDGFKVDAVDYLLKPFSINDFGSAVDKVRARLEDRRETVADTAADVGLYIKEDTGYRKINFNDIVYVKSLSEYVQIFLESSAVPITILMSLKRLEELLPEALFMRVHRSYIVNLQRLQSVRQLKIKLAGVDEPIPVGDSYRDTLYFHIENRLLK